MKDVERFCALVAVFVVHFGDPEMTKKALKSCLELDPAPGGAFVLDNSGNWPDTAWPSDEVIRPGRNLGYAGAVNMAAEVARDRGFTHVWVLNNDVSVVPDALVHFGEAFDAYPGADVVGSYVSSGAKCYFGGGGFDWRRGRPWHVHAEALVDSLPVGGAVETDWINGASMVIPIDSIVRRGGFDEHMFLYKEELEWQIRSPRALAVLVQRFLADHEVGATTGSTTGPLGGAFMARNGLLIARRRRGASRVAWMIECIWTSLLHPLVTGRFQQVKGAYIGMRSLDVSPEGVLQRVNSRVPGCGGRPMERA